MLECEWEVFEMKENPQNYKIKKIVLKKSSLYIYYLDEYQSRTPVSKQRN